MDALELHWRTALLLIVFAQLIIAALVLWVRPFEGLANRLLALLLLTIAGILVPQLIGFAGFYDAFPWLSFAPFDNALLVGPLMWAYGYALTRGKLPHWMWLVFVPALGDFVFHAYWMAQPVETRWDRIGDVYSAFYAPARTALAILVTAAGLAGTAWLYWTHRRWVRGHSSAASEFDPRWLPAFLLGFAILLVVWIALETAEAIAGPFGYSTQYPFYVLLALMTWATAQAALVLQREAFPKLTVIQHAVEDRTTRDWAAEATVLRDRIVAEGWHLEPRLTTPELARRMGTNETYLSRTINLGAGVNFNRFVNEIRVDAVKGRLASGEDDVLRVAFDCGFNSKATFNRVFLTITGQTPARFRAGARQETAHIP